MLFIYSYVEHPIDNFVESKTNIVESSGELKSTILKASVGLKPNIVWAFVDLKPNVDSKDNIVPMFQNLAIMK